ncbi:MAG TPA: L,D-transpeptidase [Thermoanaerobaculia bacterium]|nr:L,D-transpeptidase [Thermoanaerobaculia bacterium]
MSRWIGLLGSWALLVLGLGLAAVAVAGEWINVKDEQKLHRLARIDRAIEERNQAKLREFQQTVSEREGAVSTLQSRVEKAQRQIEDAQDTARIVLVSTEENKVYLRQAGEVIFEAVCSTGKGTTLIDRGRTMVFNTPIGKFRIRSRETNPVWVPPDWHYVEEARKRGMRTVTLDYGRSIDADTGGPVRRPSSEGIWSWFSDAPEGTRRIMRAQGSDVVIIENGSARRLPPGGLITAGGAVVIPPVGTSQRKFPEVLGTHRLNLGDGYALHGTQAVQQLGQSVSHGCIRLSNADIETLYGMTEVGDEVIIY